MIAPRYHVHASIIALVLGSTAHHVRADSQPGDSIDIKARAIHARVLTLDSHVDVLLPSTAAHYAGADGKSAADFDKLLRGGLDAVTLAVAVGPGPRTPAGQAEARAQTDAKQQAIAALLREHPDKLALAKSADDLVTLHQSGKIAVLESFQNARSLGTDLSELNRLYRDGVRLFGFTHAGNNHYADSSRPGVEPAEEHHGLSALGKQAVPRLNQLGIIIDVSQLTPAGVQQTIALSKAPVIASHSAVRTLVDSPRNLSDAEIDAIAKHGGVIHVTAFNAYLLPAPKDFDDKVAALRKQYGLPPSKAIERGLDTLPEAQRGELVKSLGALYAKATVKDYVDHIDYIAKRVGVEHVGIGTDFNHGAGIQGFADEADALNVTRELVRRGYTEAQIAAIWSGNFLRVFRAVEQTANALSKH